MCLLCYPSTFCKRTEWCDIRAHALKIFHLSELYIISKCIITSIVHKGYRILGYLEWWTQPVFNGVLLNVFQGLFLFPHFSHETVIGISFWHLHDPYFNGIYIRKMSQLLCWQLRFTCLSKKLAITFYNYAPPPERHRHFISYITIYEWHLLSYCKKEACMVMPYFPFRVGC